MEIDAMDINPTRRLASAWRGDSRPASVNGQRSWLIEIPIEPESKDDRERLIAALAKLAADDPAFGFSVRSEFGPIVLRGMAELQLDIKISRLRGDVKVDIFRCAHKVAFNVGAPQVVRREKIIRPASADYVYQKHSGLSGCFARVTISCEPLAPDSGFRFENRIVDEVTPKVYLHGVEKGVKSVIESGVVAGCAIVDVKVALIDAACHGCDASAFELASRAALREALMMGEPVVLEPIMNVEVAAPQDCAMLVLGDLSARGGKILGQEVCGNTNIISATVPLATMFGYVKILRSMSEGRATSVMQFDHYAPVPVPQTDPAFSPETGQRGWVPPLAARGGMQSRQSAV
jgi:elongation factor G